MSGTDIDTLRAGDVVVDVFPSAGDRIGQITVAGQPLLIDVADADRRALNWGCYPMAPWVGRIRNGRYSFEGVEHQLVINHHDDGEQPGRSHAIHGLVFDRPWPNGSDGRHVSDTSRTSLRALDWEFGGMVTQTIDLEPDHLTVSLTVESTGRRFPAELGWHPWFRKPDRLEFVPRAMYERDEFGLPTGALVDPSDGPWDDCFVNTAPVLMHFERPSAAVVRIESDGDHWVVFDEPDHATCVEPQSGPPDAFNLTPHIVEPARPLRRTMTISW